MGFVSNGSVGGGVINLGGGMDGFIIGGIIIENVECYYKNIYILFCERYFDLLIFCSENNKLAV